MKDYGKVRSIKEFFKWRAELFQDVACGIDNYMDYLARKSPTDKLLSEEIFPIAYYLRYKKHDDKLKIELNPSHEKWDAKILDINGNLVEILEVTYLPRDTSHIDRLIIAGKWKEKPSRDAFTVDDYIRQFKGGLGSGLEMLFFEEKSDFSRPDPAETALKPPGQLPAVMRDDKQTEVNKWQKS